MQPQPTTGGRTAAIYIRVSSAGQEEGSSLETQEARCRDYALAHGFDVQGVYREVHTGVQLWERPQLTTMRDAVRRREVDAVIVYAIDRLSRDPVHLGVVISEAEHAGVAVLFVSEPLDSTPEGQLIRFVRGYAAKVEHEKFKERSWRGKLARAHSGRLPGYGTPPLGYQWNEDKSRYRIDEATAPIVRRIFAESASGRTLRQIGLGLAASGIASPTGLPYWNVTSIRVILRNPAYVGAATAYRNSATPVTYSADVTPPLVDAATFAAVAERLARNQREAARNNRHPEATLLRAGYVRCGYCSRLVGITRVASPGRMPRLAYRCTNATSAACRGEHAVFTHILDAAVWERVRSVLTDPRAIRDHLEALLGDDPTAADLAAIQRRQADVQRRSASLVRGLTEVKTDGARVAITAGLDELTATAAALEAEHAAVTARRAQWEQARERMDDIELWCQSVGAEVDSMTYQDKRDALAALGVDVRLYRADHEPRWTLTMNLPLPVPDDAIVCNGAVGRTWPNRPSGPPGECGAASPLAAAGR